MRLAPTLVRRALCACVLLCAAPSYAQAGDTCVDVSQTGRMLVSDVREVFTSQWLTLGIGLGAAAGTHPLDARADRWVDAQGPSHVTRAGQVAGSWQSQVPLAAALIVSSAVHGCTRPLSHDLLRALGVNQAVTQALKFSVRRERPNHDALHVSFPSGHASSTFALATVLAQRVGWKAAVPAYGLATYTAWTRVRDDQHWVSDVVFGGALGVAVGRAVVRTGRLSRWSVIPSANSTSYSVLVVH